MKFKFSTNAAIRAVSLVLIQTFLFQQICFAAPDFKPAQIDLFQQPAARFTLPAWIATVDQAYEAPGSKKTIYLLQDAHTNESGQLNLARAIETIVRRQNVKLIFGEAASGDNSLEFLRSFGSLEDRRQAAAAYLRKGILHGEEYLQVTTDLDLDLWGVEDSKLYVDTLEAYREVAVSRDRLERYLSSVEQAVAFLKPRVYNPSLLSLDQLHDKYLKEELPLTEYFASLLQQAAQRGVDVSDLRNFRALERLQKLERSVDFARAGAELDAAVNGLPKEARREIEEFQNARRSPSKLVSGGHEDRRGYFALLGEKLGRSKSSFPELAKYLRYSKAADEIDFASLFGEQRILERRLFASACVSTDEANLVAAAQGLRNLKKLLSLNLLPEDYDAYREDAKRHDIRFITGFLNRQLMDRNTGYEKIAFLEDGYEDAVRSAERFYELTYARDRAFVERSLAKMNADGQDRAVLITGGFHTPSLKHLLKSQNISYVVITPRVLSETDQARYERILLSQRSSEAVPAAAPAAFGAAGHSSRTARLAPGAGIPVPMIENPAVPALVGFAGTLPQSQNASNAAVLRLKRSVQIGGARPDGARLGLVLTRYPGAVVDLSNGVVVRYAYTDFRNKPWRAHLTMTGAEGLEVVVRRAFYDVEEPVTNFKDIVLTENDQIILNPRSQSERVEIRGFDILNDSMRLYFVAPRSIGIHRAEAKAKLPFASDDSHLPSYGMTHLPVEDKGAAGEGGRLSAEAERAAVPQSSETQSSVYLQNASGLLTELLAFKQMGDHEVQVKLPSGELKRAGSAQYLADVLFNLRLPGSVKVVAQRDTDSQKVILYLQPVKNGRFESLAEKPFRNMETLLRKETTKEIVWKDLTALSGYFADAYNLAQPLMAQFDGLEDVSAQKVGAGSKAAGQGGSNEVPSRTRVVLDVARQISLASQSETFDARDIASRMTEGGRPTALARSFYRDRIPMGFNLKTVIQAVRKTLYRAKAEGLVEQIRSGSTFYRFTAEGLKGFEEPISEGARLSRTDLADAIGRMGRLSSLWILKLAVDHPDLLSELQSPVVRSDLENAFNNRSVAQIQELLRQLKRAGGAAGSTAESSTQASIEELFEKNEERIRKNLTDFTDRIWTLYLNSMVWTKKDYLNRLEREPVLAAGARLVQEFNLAVRYVRELNAGLTQLGASDAWKRTAAEDSLKDIVGSEADITFDGVLMAVRSIQDRLNGRVGEGESRVVRFLELAVVYANLAQFQLNLKELAWKFAFDDVLGPKFSRAFIQATAAVDLIERLGVGAPNSGVFSAPAPVVERTEDGKIEIRLDNRVIYTVLPDDLDRDFERTLRVFGISVAFHHALDPQSLILEARLPDEPSQYIEVWNNRTVQTAARYTSNFVDRLQGLLIRSQKKILDWPGARLTGSTDSPLGSRLAYVVVTRDQLLLQLQEAVRTGGAQPRELYYNDEPVLELPAVTPDKGVTAELANRIQNVLRPKIYGDEFTILSFPDRVIVASHEEEPIYFEHLGKPLALEVKSEPGRPHHRQIQLFIGERGDDGFLSPLAQTEIKINSGHVVPNYRIAQNIVQKIRGNVRDERDLFQNEESGKNALTTALAQRASGETRVSGDAKPAGARLGLLSSSPSLAERRGIGASDPDKIRSAFEAGLLKRGIDLDPIQKEALLYNVTAGAPAYQLEKYRFLMPQTLLPLAWLLAGHPRFPRIVANVAENRREIDVTEEEWRQTDASKFLDLPALNDIAAILREARLSPSSDPQAAYQLFDIVRHPPKSPPDAAEIYDGPVTYQIQRNAAGSRLAFARTSVLYDDADLEALADSVRVDDEASASGVADDESEIPDGVLDRVNRYPLADGEELAPSEPLDYLKWHDQKIAFDRWVAKHKIAAGELVKFLPWGGQATRAAVILGGGAKSLFTLQNFASLDLFDERQFPLEVFNLKTDDENRVIREKLATFQRELRSRIDASSDDDFKKYLLGLSFGAHQIVNYRAELEKLAEELGHKEAAVADFVKRNGKFIIAVNDLTGEGIVREFVENDFFGFDPENIVFMQQDTLPVYVRIGGKLVEMTESLAKELGFDEPIRVTYGHGYLATQMKTRGTGFKIREYPDGSFEPDYIEDLSPYEYMLARGGEYLTNANIDDNPQLAGDVLPVDRFAFALKEMTHGVDTLAEVLENPSGQKGGFGLKKPGAQGDIVAEGSALKLFDVKAYLNRMLVFTQIRAQSEVTEKPRLHWAKKKAKNKRGQEITYYFPETYFTDAMTWFVPTRTFYSKGLAINTFKQPLNVARRDNVTEEPGTGPLMLALQEDPRFLKVAREIFDRRSQKEAFRVQGARLITAASPVERLAPDRFGPVAQAKLPELLQGPRTISVLDRNEVLLTGLKLEEDGRRLIVSPENYEGSPATVEIRRVVSEEPGRVEAVASVSALMATLRLQESQVLAMRRDIAKTFAHPTQPVVVAADLSAFNGSSSTAAYTDLLILGAVGVREGLGQNVYMKFAGTESELALAGARLVEFKRIYPKLAAVVDSIFGPAPEDALEARLLPLGAAASSGGTYHSWVQPVEQGGIISTLLWVLLANDTARTGVNDPNGTLTQDFVHYYERIAHVTVKKVSDLISATRGTAALDVLKRVAWRVLARSSLEGFMSLYRAKMAFARSA